MTTAAASPRIVLDQQAAGGFDAERKRGLLKSLLDGGYAVTLGGRALGGRALGGRALGGRALGEEASDGAPGQVAPLDDSPLLVLRNAPAEADEVTQVSATGDEEGQVSVSWHGVAGLGDEEVLGLVRHQSADAPAPGEWKPWFPVIDYDRCTNCMQCLSFCLFGVYDVDTEKKIDVAEPQRCKTNCPACSRVCPEVAILFPKYKNGPINGDVVKGEDLEREKMKTDISSLLGGDIYALLRERHERANSRFSKERDDARALAERQRCLAKLQEQFDIPDEVLNELPSAETIRAKAAQRVAARAEPPEIQTPENNQTRHEETEP